MRSGPFESLREKRRIAYSLPLAPTKVLTRRSAGGIFGSALAAFMPAGQTKTAWAQTRVLEGRTLTVRERQVVSMLGVGQTRKRGRLRARDRRRDGARSLFASQEEGYIALHLAMSSGAVDSMRALLADC